MEEAGWALWVWLGQAAAMVVVSQGRQADTQVACMVPPVMVLHAVLDLGRIARHVESGVEGVPVAAAWLM